MPSWGTALVVASWLSWATCRGTQEDLNPYPMSVHHQSWIVMDSHGMFFGASACKRSGVYALFSLFLFCLPSLPFFLLSILGWARAKTSWHLCTPTWCYVMRFLFNSCINLMLLYQFSFFLLRYQIGVGLVGGWARAITSWHLRTYVMLHHEIFSTLLSGTCIYIYK